MLILTRRPGERVVIGDEILVTVMGVSGHTVRLGIAAPEGVAIYREEIWLAVKGETRGRRPHGRPAALQPARAGRQAAGGGCRAGRPEAGLAAELLISRSLPLLRIGVLIHITRLAHGRSVTVARTSSAKRSPRCSKSR